MNNFKLRIVKNGKESTIEVDDFEVIEDYHEEIHAKHDVKKLKSRMKHSRKLFRQ